MSETMGWGEPTRVSRDSSIRVMLILLRPLPRLSVGLGGILLGRSPENVTRMRHALLPPYVWPFLEHHAIARVAKFCFALFFQSSAGQRSLVCYRGLSTQCANVSYQFLTLGCHLYVGTEFRMLLFAMYVSHTGIWMAKQGCDPGDPF